MSDQNLGRSGPWDHYPKRVPISKSFVIPAIIVSGVLVAACIAIVILCLQKKRKEQEGGEKRPTEDGIEEDLIEANNNTTQFASPPSEESGLKQGVRAQPTRNPEHKKWYESKAIPFMDSSMGSIPDAVGPANV